jgi:putative ABC transport system permease protein
MALGAGRWRVLRQIVTESVVIAFFGAVAGILLAELASRLLLTLKPEDLRDLNAPVLNTTSLLFAIAISVLCGIVFGLAPASQLLAGRANIHSSSRSNTSRTRLRSGMVIAECAMALILLTGAGLLLRSFWKLLSVDSGFDANQLLTLRLNLPASRYKEIPTQIDFLRRLDRELAQIPGVESAGLVGELPMAGIHMEHNLSIKGRPEPEIGKEPEISAHEAGPTYFQTMRIPLLSGRAFTLQDTETSERVAVISRSMAEQYWPNQSPIGSQVRWARSDKVEWMTIVGVVGDIRHDGLDDEAYPAVYTPYTQKPMPWKRFLSVVVRTQAPDPMSLAGQVKEAVWKVDSQLPITYLEPMSAVIAESLSERRFTMVLLTVFASLALALAVIGIYGIASYHVTQRTQEIGIRMALGARPATVLRMMIHQGVLLSIAGVLIGTVGAFLLSRVAQGLLFQVNSTDPLAFTSSAVALVLVAALACYIPARRAARIDPMRALRAE